MNSEPPPPTDSDGQEALDEIAAFRLAARLIAIPGFPRREEPIEAVADWLIAHCKPRQYQGQPWSSKEQAKWLISTAIEEWREWAGVPALRDLWVHKFQPGVREYYSLGTPPKPACPRCADNGIIPRLGGGADWCDCEGAELLRSQCPDLCDARNRRAIRPASRPPGPASPAAPAQPIARITQLDVDRALAAHRAAQTPTHAPVAVESQGSEKAAKKPERRD